MPAVIQRNLLSLSKLKFFIPKVEVPLGQRFLSPLFTDIFLAPTEVLDYSKYPDTE